MTGRRDPERDLDDLLQDDGGEIGNLYRRLPRYEPPRRLDRAVLGEAARAVHSGKPPRRQRWVVGIGSVAGLVLAAGIAWRIGHDAMNQDAVMSSQAAKPSVVPVEPISESARAKHEVAEPQAAEAPAAAAPPAPAPKADAESAPRVQQDEAKPRRELSRAQAQDKLKERAAPAAPPPPPAASVSAPAAQAFPSETPPADTGAALGGTMKHRKSVPANAAEPVEGDAAGRSQPFAAPTTSVELRRDMQLAPEDWLAHIHQLLRQGRRQQATESLRLFERAHPDWQLPDDLKALRD